MYNIAGTTPPPPPLPPLTLTLIDTYKYIFEILFSAHVCYIIISIRLLTVHVYSHSQSVHGAVCCMLISLSLYKSLDCHSNYL